MYSSTRRAYSGFTLIELLVVVAIIGILSAVVITSVAIARKKGEDAGIKSNLNNARTQAVVFYDNHAYSYSGICANTTDGIANMMAGAQARSLDVVCTDPSSNASTTWVMSAQLKYDSTTYYCVDSTSSSTIRSSQIAANASQC